MATELSRHAGYEGQLQVERVSSVVEREFNLQLWEHVYVPPNWKAARSLWRPHSSASYLGADEAYRVVPGLPAWEVVKSYIGAACAVGKRADEDGEAPTQSEHCRLQWLALLAWYRPACVSWQLRGCQMENTSAMTTR
jgi:hypothetical protein